jgi:hypothetical protein
MQNASPSALQHLHTMKHAREQLFEIATQLVAQREHHKQPLPASALASLRDTGHQLFTSLSDWLDVNS